MSHYVYSTIGQDMLYTQYKKTSHVPVPVSQVLIRGGAHVIDKNLHTPRGIVTKISDEQLKILENIELFKMHKENGFIVVQSNKENPTKVAQRDMKEKDDSAQKTTQDFIELRQKHPENSPLRPAKVK